MHAQSRLLQPPLHAHTLDLTLFTVVSKIHDSLIVQSNRRSILSSKSHLMSFTARLLKRVRADIHESTLGIPLDSNISWEACVFRPIIATLDITYIWDVCIGDAEYILLLSTILALAFELLLLAGKSNAGRIRTFLTRAFNEYFAEPAICRTVGMTLETERRRLAEKFVDVGVLRTIQHVRGLLPDIDFCTAAWKTQMNSQTSKKKLNTVYIDRQDRKPDSLPSKWRMRGRFPLD